MVRRLATLLFLVALSGTAHAEPRRIFDRIVAVVDHDPILLSELRTALRPYEQSAANLDEKTHDKLIRDCLDRLIDLRLEAQEADRKGLRVSEEEIDRAFEQIMKQNGLPKSAFIAELDKLGLSEAAFRGELRKQIIEARLVFLTGVKPDPSLDERAMREKLEKARTEMVAKLRKAAYIEVRI